MDAFELFSEEQNMMCSPLQAVITMGIYVAFVKKVGPYIMKTRDAFQLKEVLLIYNLLQIVLNALLFMMAVQNVSITEFPCFPALRKDDDNVTVTLHAHFYYYVLKMLDFLDTVFMVLRKKDKQISFLHVYHHISTFAFAWYSGAYYPGGIAFCVGIGNTFVHSVMYLYYLVSLVKQNSRNIIWWKKYVTLIQIAQHWILLSIGIFSILNSHCEYRKDLNAIGICNMIILIYYFTKFYKNNYLSHKENVH